jgi:protein-S-isoprenylcysteine O-methyltransferase Ste14
MHGIVLLVEEPYLEKQFGKSYVEYKNSANRWLPSFQYSAHRRPNQ